MPTSTLLAPGTAGSRFKTILWIALGLTTLFVFITSEVLLVTDYPMYHSYRLQVIADRHLLIPHTLAGILALLIGPVNFSTRIRQRHLRDSPPTRPSLRCFCLCRVVHRDRTRSRPSGPSRHIHAGRGMDGLHCRRFHHCAQSPDRAASPVDGAVLCRYLYLRFQRLQSIPAYWSHLGDVLSAVGVIAFTLASLLIVDIGLNWHELTHRRS